MHSHRALLTGDTVTLPIVGTKREPHYAEQSPYKSYTSGERKPVHGQQRKPQKDCKSRAAILHWLKTHDYVTITQVVKTTGIDNRTVHSMLRFMENDGVLSRCGLAKTGSGKMAVAYKLQGEK